MKREKPEQQQKKDPLIEAIYAAFDRENIILKEMIKFGEIGKGGPLGKEDSEDLEKAILSYQQAHKETIKAVDDWRKSSGLVDFKWDR